jgi:hypothetical protein
VIEKPTIVSYPYISRQVYSMINILRQDPKPLTQLMYCLPSLSSAQYRQYKLPLSASLKPSHVTFDIKSMDDMV